VWSGHSHEAEATIAEVIELKIDPPVGAVRNQEWLVGKPARTKPLLIVAIFLVQPFHMASAD